MLFYVAFVKRSFVGCLDYTEENVYTVTKDNLCANELGNFLWSILIIMVIKNFINFALPVALGLINEVKKWKLYDSWFIQNDN